MKGNAAKREREYFLFFGLLMSDPLSSMFFEIFFSCSFVVVFDSVALKEGTNVDSPNFVGEMMAVLIITGDA